MSLEVRVETRKLNGIWIPIEIKIRDKVIRSTGLLNSGFFYLEEDFRIPIISLPQGFLMLEGIPWTGPSRKHPDLLELDIGSVYVRVVAEDKTSEWIDAEVFGSFKDHIVLSKDLVGKLGVKIEDLYDNTWSFRGDKRIRHSENATIYRIVPHASDK